MAALGALAALAAALVWFLQFSDFDVGLGRAPSTPDPQQTSTSPDGAAAAAGNDAGAAAVDLETACELRLDSEGLHQNGEAITTAKAIAACRPAGRAMLTVTGDARYGELKRTREALEGAGVAVHVR